jgi:ABC-type phosphate transport system substrate-binding protein
MSFLVSHGAVAETVIVHPGVPAQQLSNETLRSVMSMRMRSWDDGTPVRVFVLRDQHPVHQQFCKRVLGLFPHQLRRTWDRLVYAGLGQAPTQVESQQQMRQLVAETPGAIGYLEKDMIDDSVRELTVE